MRGLCDGLKRTAKLGDNPVNSDGIVSKEKKAYPKTSDFESNADRT